MCPNRKGFTKLQPQYSWRPVPACCCQGWEMWLLLCASQTLQLGRCSSLGIAPRQVPEVGGMFIFPLEKQKVN